MTDWILLTYQIHDGIERMIIPPAKHPKPNWNWLFYTAYALYKLYSYQ